MNRCSECGFSIIKAGNTRCPKCGARPQHLSLPTETISEYKTVHEEVAAIAAIIQAPPVPCNQCGNALSDDKTCLTCSEIPTEKQIPPPEIIAAPTMMPITEAQQHKTPTVEPVVAPPVPITVQGECQKCGAYLSNTNENCIECGHHQEDTYTNHSNNHPKKGMMHVTNFVFRKKSDDTPPNIFSKILAPTETILPTIQQIAVQPANLPTTDHIECLWCGYHLVDETKDCPNCDNNNTTPKQPIEAKEEKNNDFFAFRKITKLDAAVQDGFPFVAPLSMIAHDSAPNIAPNGTTAIIECAWCSYHLSNVEENCPNCGYNNAPNDEIAAPSIQLIHQKDQQTHVFEGNTIKINGADLEVTPTNEPQTSEVEVKFECIEGVWYLSNKNAAQPIFVEVLGKIPIDYQQLIIINQKAYRFSDGKNE
jgi:rubrerythrin